MIDPNKKYQTRDGREVQFLHRVPEGYPGSFPWRGIVNGMEHSWRSDGSVNFAADARDLVEVPPQPREWWVNVYDLEDQWTIYSSKGEADMCAMISRIECVHVREVLPDQP